MTNDIDRYTADLTRHLRLRNVPAAEIDDAVAVVESHVGDTGESPEAAFGPARDYARTFPRTSTPPQRWRRYQVGWLVASLAAALLIYSLAAQTRGDDFVGDIDPVVGIVVGAIVLVAWAAWLLAAVTIVRRRS